jgi:hypothetical protein
MSTATRAPADNDSSVLEPCLEIVGRCFDNEGKLKIRRFHRGDGVGAQIVYQAECMSPVWADEDVRTARVLSPEPSESGVYLPDAPILS